MDWSLNEWVGLFIDLRSFMALMGLRVGTERAGTPEPGGQKLGADSLHVSTLKYQTLEI